MKKYFLMVALAATCVLAYAQPRAVGVNLGSGLGISYQHNLGSANFLDVAASLPVVVDGLGVGGHVTYDWVDPFGAAVPWNNKGSWDWYMGVGGAGGVYGLLSTDAKNTWYAGVAGHIGIEYNFWFPLNLSLDWRPCVGVAGNDGLRFGLEGLYSGISLGVRYKF